ncbi:MAG: hypothetical protein JZU65_14825, partial [Chlorobium sp.]|nr:hypothetical protein [Chlorobium sp.]
MSKIIIVGHPESGYQKIEHLLKSCGMETARASKNENLSPADICSVLRQAHKIPAVETITSEADVMQIQPGPVWNGLALDLWLGNIDQKVWGWADPQAINLLDYWKSLDPELMFLLAYNEPHSVFFRTHYEDINQCTSESVFRLLDNWTAYNSALLNFYLRNTDRSFLLNIRQVPDTPDYFLGQLKTRFGVLLQEPAFHAMKRYSVLQESCFFEPNSSSLDDSVTANGSNGNGKSEIDIFLID